MEFNCVCMQQLESRTLLAAGIVDTGYTAPYNNTAGGYSLTESILNHIDGKTLHLGWPGEVPALWRQNPNGFLDTSFGSGGRITFSRERYAEDMAVGSDAKIAVVLNTGLSDSERLHVARYTANGTLDASFGGDGEVEIANAHGEFGSNIVVQPDGKIVVGGEEFNDSMFFYRLNTNGSLDTSFGVGGKVVIHPPA